MNEFLETFEAHHRLVNENYTHDDVELDEFIEYYENVSFAVDDDKEFEMILQNTWNLRQLNKYKDVENQQKVHDRTGAYGKKEPEKDYRPGYT